jgi:ABC-type multidrug transport system fused ATPase/permease subunit
MLATYKRLWGLLTARERHRAALLLVLILVMGFTQMAGVASVMPFMSMAANPQAVETHSNLAAAYAFFGFGNTRQFLLFLGFMVFAGLVAAITTKALTTYALTRFIETRSYSLSRKLMAGYLNQPYDWFLSRHSADLGKNILSEAEQVIKGGISPALYLIAEGVVVITLVALLIMIQPRLAITVAVVLGSSYAAIYMVLRNFLKRTGAERVSANHRRFEAVQEAFGSIKEVKVGGLEGIMLRRFDAPAYRFARAHALEATANQMPRFAIEVLAFGGLLIMIIYLLARPGGLQQHLPMLAAYAFAAYRLMPALQNVYANTVGLRFAGPALEALHRELAASAPEAGAQLPEERARPLGLARSLSLDGVSYAYPGSKRLAVRNLSLDVRANTTVGLVGRTGAGKTTTVDIVLGLLRPQQGTLRVDGVAIGPDNLRAWQVTIGYVPQHIYLADASVTANIAFGVAPNQVNHDAVERAARIANLHELVTQELPNGYETMVGERGVRLSGGQRQRIGIARALYHDPDLLVLDEATSALDNVTEQAVMEAVHNLGRRKTIIIIAHRLTTVRACDTIVLLEDGEVVAQGRFDDLAHGADGFRMMLAAAAHQ